MLGLVGCKPDGTTDLIELGEVGAFVSEKGYTAEDFKEKLVGQFNEDIIHSWGDPDIQLSGFWGDRWYLDDDNYRYITLYYNAKGYVEDIIIGTNEEETGGTTTLYGLQAEVTEILDNETCCVKVIGNDDNFNEGDTLVVTYSGIHENSETISKSLEVGDIIAVTYKNYEEKDSAYAVAVEYVDLISPTE